MAQPKKRTSKTKTGMRRSHLMEKLRRTVNKTSPVKAGPVKKTRPLPPEPKAAKTRPAKAAPAAKKAKPAPKTPKKPAAKPKAKSGGKAAKPKT
ncbi:50S ribosomal protein L32 [Candidatus Saccharibacteria bacterium]|nr:50S ribosomal protein L32 [Candidatus Saccharibacteria bacterium]